VSWLGVSLLTYVWHYLFARMLYDHLLRPLGRGDLAELLLLAGTAALAYLLGRRMGRRA
jgi:hypothetical protein